MKKIIFFGTPRLAADILKNLIKSEHEVIAVVTQPDRVSGRGLKVTMSPVKEEAQALGIPVLQPQKVGDEAFLDGLNALGADLFAVAAYAQKLPARLLEMAPLGCINVHPSLLPKYRGAAPLTAAILNGDRVSGVTIIKMAEKMDAGDILMQREMPLEKKETRKSIEEKAITLGSELLIETIDGLEKGTIVPRAQDEGQSTYVRQIGKDAGQIDFNESAEVIERKVRAYDPWPGTFTHLKGKILKILKAEAVTEEALPEGTLPEEDLPGEALPEEAMLEEDLPGEALPEKDSPGKAMPEEALPEESLPWEERESSQHESAKAAKDDGQTSRSESGGDVARKIPKQKERRFLPGEVAFVDKKQIFIATGEGFLKPLEVQPEGKRKMTAEEFLRGRQIKQGEIFG